jgi:ketosteroid isomerase-like protein
MSREDVEIVRRSFEAFERGGFEGLLRHLDPEVEWTTTGSYIDRGTYRGHEGVRRYLGSMLDDFEDFRVRPAAPRRMEFADLGERVLAWGNIHVRATTSGIETDIESGGVFEFREGKIVRWEDFGSRDKALEAIGSE